MVYVEKVRIPDEINVLAVPSSWIQGSEAEVGGRKVFVIERTPPRSRVFTCLNCGEYVYELLMVPRGTIDLNHYNNSQYLVFRRTEEHVELYDDRKLNIWQATDKEPQAYVVTFEYTLTSDKEFAMYRVLKTKNVIMYITDSTSSFVASVATMLLILPTDRPAIVEYIKTECPYFGYCRRVIETKKIMWKDGQVIVEDII